MKPPCMLIVVNVLPIIRALIAKQLIEKYNFKLVDAARKMNVTPSAITQYLKGSRGGKILKEIKECDALNEAVTVIAEELSKEDSNMEKVLEKICESCKALRREKVLCEAHMTVLPDLKASGCKLCLMNG